MTAAILYQNLADPEFGATVTASSWIAAAPPPIMQNVHVTRRWKGSGGGAEHILVTWPSPRSIDTIALLGLAGIFGSEERSLTSDATRRIRVSSADLTGLTGDLWDSGQASGQIREEYAALVALRPAAMSARAVRIDFAETGADALMAGRVVIGLRRAFTLNFSYDWSFGYADLSRKRKSAGGLSFVDRDDRYRVLSLAFESLTSADRYSFVQEIDRLNGVSSDVLFVIDADSTEPDRDSVWGLIQDMSPPTQPNMAYFAKRYQIEERR